MSHYKASSIVFSFGLLLSLGFSPMASAYVSFTSLGIGMATAINDAGQVVGYSGTYAAPIATLWNGSTPTTLSTPEGSWSIASDINNLGQVVGVIGSGTGAAGISQAAFWNGGITTILGSVGGQYAAHGINDAGQIVGYTFYPANSNNQAILWNGNTPTILGAQSFASAINNTGQVVGFSNGQATLWNSSSSITLDNPSGAYDSQAYGINNNDQVVGYSYYNSGYQATLWNGSTPTKLGTLGGTHSGAFDINDAGQIVGFSDTVTNISHATLWNMQNGIAVALDLNSLINPALGFTLTSAQSINNTGQIAGYALNSLGQTEAYVLSVATVPIPSGWLLMLSGLGLTGFITKRRKYQAG